MARIELDQVDLTFHVRQRMGRMTIKEYLIRGMFLRRSAPLMKVCALQGLNLEGRLRHRLQRDGLRRRSP